MCQFPLDGIGKSLYRQAEIRIQLFLALVHTKGVQMVNSWHGSSAKVLIITCLQKTVLSGADWCFLSVRHVV